MVVCLRALPDCFRVMQFGRVCGNAGWKEITELLKISLLILVVLVVMYSSILLGAAIGIANSLVIILFQ